jgi:putative transposase
MRLGISPPAVQTTIMADYRRNRVSGGTYFFTVNLHDRSSGLLVDRIDLLRASVARVRSLASFHIDAWVVLPDHTHCLWTLPENDANFSGRWQAIKMAFSKGVKAGEALCASAEARGERGIWQRRFWEHTIRDERDYAAHMDYIHFNPVKHGLVANVGDWPFSSFHRSVAMGLYPAAWAGDDSGEGVWGEAV